VIQVEDTRSQARNREIARERLVEMIRAALVAPKRRIATKPTLGSQRRRVAAKTQRGEVKALRGKIGARNDRRQKPPPSPGAPAITAHPARPREPRL
jgi:protein subunit release factor B